MPSVANVPEGLKYQKRMCRNGLGVGVKFCMMCKAAIIIIIIIIIQKSRKIGVDIYIRHPMHGCPDWG